ncbi:unnamed protein product [Calypogeia fissa]
MLPIKRGLYGLFGRVAKLSHQHEVGTYPLSPVLGLRVLSLGTTSIFFKRNVSKIGGEHHQFTSLVLGSSRSFAVSSQLSVLDTPEEAESVSSLLSVLETPEEAEWHKKMAFLVSLGLTKDQAHRVLKQCPLLLPMSVEDELEPKVVFLKTLGVTDLAKVIVFSPNLLICKIEMNLMPKVAFFESLGIQRQSIGKIIERYPTVLTYSVDGNMMSKTKFLESIGLERENIARVIMRSPYIFALSIEENMRPKVELLESIGVDKRFMSKLITRCPKIFCLSNEDNVLPKIKYLESVGVQKGSMGKIVATCPSILNLSTSHIQKKLDFLQANDYCVKKVVNEFPVYLTYSLEHRIKPRHELIACLKELGLLKKDYSLSHILQISQRQFFRDFVQSHPQGASIYTGS